VRHRFVFLDGSAQGMRGYKGHGLPSSLLHGATVFVYFVTRVQCVTLQMAKRIRKRVPVSRKGQEERFRCCRLLYKAAEGVVGLNEKDFSVFLEKNVCAERRFGGGARRAGAIGWVARGLGEPDGEERSATLYRSFEVLVAFCRQIRVARSSSRLWLGVGGWQDKIEVVPEHGIKMCGFFAAELSRWEQGVRSFGVRELGTEVLPSGHPALCKFEMVTVDSLSEAAAEAAGTGSVSVLPQGVGRGSRWLRMERLVERANELRSALAHIESWRSGCGMEDRSALLSCIIRDGGA
jgi:hypothetical protein